MTGVYILLVVVLIVSIVSIILSIVLSKKTKSKKELSVSDIEMENAKLQQHIDINDTKLSGAINAQKDQLTIQQQHFDSFMMNMNSNFSQLKEDVNRSISEVKDNNAKSLEAVRKDNSEQLEKMRQTVDEKLNETLERRFDQSFKIVNDRLEEINKTFMELQGLQTGVQDLNKIFKNVKTRGTWGEVSLENLLSQILTSGQYKKQVQLKKGSLDMVDFAIVMPGKDDEAVYLPVDSKFPIEDYIRIQAACDEGDTDAVQAALKQLIITVKNEAKSIQEKYIVNGITTDFAIMYLPTEGLYAEVIKNDGLIEEIQNKYRVVVCGPTTIAALLNSLQMGFRSVAIEKRSAEISKLMTAFMEDFAKFTKILQQTGERIDRVKTSIDEAEKRTSIIQKKLGKVQQISGETAPDVSAILNSSEDVAFDEADLIED